VKKVDRKLRVSAEGKSFLEYQVNRISAGTTRLKKMLIELGTSLNQIYEIILNE